MLGATLCRALTKKTGKWKGGNTWHMHEPRESVNENAVRTKGGFDGDAHMHVRKVGPCYLVDL